MSTVVKFPKDRHYRPTLRGTELYAQQEPTPEMVWEMCPYIHVKDDHWRCKHCPAKEVDDNYAGMTRGCYGFAAEACRVVFAMQEREKNK